MLRSGGERVLALAELTVRVITLWRLVAGVLVMAWFWFVVRANIWWSCSGGGRGQPQKLIAPGRRRDLS